MRINTFNLRKMTRRLLHMRACALIVLCAAAAAAPALNFINDDNPAGDSDLYQTIRSRGLTEFAGYVTTAGMQQMLTSTLSRFTVFAPTNAAFARLTQEQRRALTDPTTLTELMRYHLLSGEVPSRTMGDDLLLPTLSANRDIRINMYGTKDNERFYANGAELRPADVTASNGILHVIDTVLFPPTQTITAFVAAEKDFSRLSDMLTAGKGETAKLLDGVEPYTLFAPTDDAFAKLPSATLDYIRTHDPQLLDEMIAGHVMKGTLYQGGMADGATETALSGDTLTFTVSPAGLHSVNGAAISKPDLNVINGVVHGVDSILFPPANAFRKLILLGLTDFATLVDKAGLRDMLSRPEQTFTLFTPTNDALATLTDAEQSALKNPDVLMRFVRYHMAGGAIKSSDLRNEEVVPSLDAPFSVRFNTYGSELFANGRRVVARDQQATNGVIHTVAGGPLTSPTLRTASTTAYEEILRRPDTKVLANAMSVDPEFAAVLKASSPLTAFVPNDAAFAALPAGTTALLRKYPTALASVLKFHIAGGTYYTGGLSPGMAIKSLNGQTLNIGADDKGALTVNGVPIVTADTSVSNGVVHTIGTVLFPVGNVFETVIFNGMKELAARLDSTGLAQTLQDQTKRFTLFGFQDVALARLSPDAIKAMDDPKMLRAAIAYHISDRIEPSSQLTDESIVPTMGGVPQVPGVRINIYAATQPKTEPTMYVNGRPIVQTDIACSNGLMHVIDGVLFPLPAPSVADILNFDPRLEGLRNLTAAAGIGALLAGKGPITLFAPTEDALRKLPEGVRGILLANPQVAEGILRYHIALHTLYSPALYNGAVIKTASGSNMHVTRDEGGAIRIGSATVLEHDYSAGNGVVHVIDELLIPPHRDLMQEAIFGGLSEFLGLATASGIDQLLSGDQPVTVFAVSNGALSRLSQPIRDRLAHDATFLKTTMQYHVVQGAVPVEALTNDRVFRSLAPTRALLRSNMYADKYYINGVPIVGGTAAAVNGVLHILEDFVFPPTESILDHLYSDGRFTTFLDHLRVTGLMASINGTTAFTVLPPTDEAFAAADPERIAAWGSDIDDRRRMVLNHIALTTWMRRGLATQTSLPMLSGEKLPVSVNSDGVLLIEGTAPTQPDLLMTNGVVHTMGVVLDPGATAPAGGKGSNNHLGLILGITIPVAVVVAAIGLFLYKKTRHSEYTRI